MESGLRYLPFDNIDPKEIEQIQTDINKYGIYITAISRVVVISQQSRKKKQLMFGKQ